MPLSQRKMLGVEQMFAARQKVCGSISRRGVREGEGGESVVTETREGMFPVRKRRRVGQWCQMP